MCRCPLWVLCSKQVDLVELVPLLAEYFELAWMVVFYDNDSRQSCDCYDTPQHLGHRRAPKLASGKMLENKIENLKVFSREANQTIFHPGKK